MTINQSHRQSISCGIFEDRIDRFRRKHPRQDCPQRAAGAVIGAQVFAEGVQADRQLLVAVQLPDKLCDLVSFLVAHTGCRFVEQEEPGPQRQRHHDLIRALIPVRELANQTIRFLCQAAHLQQLCDACPDLFALLTALPQP